MPTDRKIKTTDRIIKSLLSVLVIQVSALTYVVIDNESKYEDLLCKEQIKGC